MKGKYAGTTGSRIGRLQQDVSDVAQAAKEKRREEKPKKQELKASFQ